MRVFLYGLLISGVLSVPGCSDEKEPDTPYIYCLDDPSFLFPFQYGKRFESWKVADHILPDSTIIPSEAQSYLVFYDNFRFDLDIYVDCYFNDQEPFCDSLYTGLDNFILALEGRFNYSQDKAIKLTPICFPGNPCIEVNVETLTGRGTLHVDGSTDGFWDDQIIGFQYTQACEVGFNQLTDEYFPIGPKSSIEIELPMKKGEKFKAYFED